MKLWSNKVQEYFNSKAENYDKVHFTDNSIRFIFERKRFEMVNRQLKSKGKILDAACGTGHYIANLNKDFNHYGADISDEMVNICKGKGMENIVKSSFESLPFDDNFFESVICVNAFQYSKNPKKALKELLRVTKDKGILVITLWNSRSIRNFIRSILASLFIKNNIEDRHVFYSEEKFLSLISEYNINISNIEYYNFGPWWMSHKEHNPVLIEFLRSIESKANRSMLKKYSSEFIVKIIKNG